MPAPTVPPVRTTPGPVATAENDDPDDDDDEDDDDHDDFQPTPSPTAEQPRATPTRTTRPGDSVSAEGPIEAISGGSVTVRGVVFLVAADTEYRGEDGEQTSLAAFSVGDDVKARGEVRASGVVLSRLEKDD